MPAFLLVASLIILSPVAWLGLRHPFADRRAAHIADALVLAMVGLLPALLCFLMRPVLGGIAAALVALLVAAFAAQLLGRERGLSRVLAELDNPHLRAEVPRRLLGLLRATRARSRFRRGHDEHALYGASTLLLHGMWEEAEEVVACVEQEEVNPDLRWVCRSFAIVFALHRGALDEARALTQIDPKELAVRDRPRIAPAIALVAAIEERSAEAAEWIALDRPPTPGQVFAAVRALAVAHRRASLGDGDGARGALAILPEPALKLALRLAHSATGPGSAVARQLEGGDGSPYR